MEIYHITTSENWESALAEGTYTWSTAGQTLAEVGFIHASTAEQLPATAQFVYGADTHDLVVLRLDSSDLEAAGTTLLWEAAENGQTYPHIYGPIDTNWVREVRAAEVDASGRFTYVR